MTRSLPQGLTVKAALVLGFGATFGLWLGAGLYFTQRLAEVQRESAAVHVRYMQAQELLTTVRMQVLLGSVYVRDALLDPDPQTTSDYRRQVLSTYAAVDAALRNYIPVLDSVAERQRVDGLRREIEGLRETLLDVLATDRSRWATEARRLLGQIMPRREAVLRISDEVQALNRSAFVQQEEAVGRIYAATQRRIWETLGFALAASLGIALLATVYVLRLERDLRLQRRKEAQNTSDLQRLSAKLVTAQEEERRTIARELHDEVGQLLQAVKVELSLAQRSVESAAGSGRLLDDALAITDSALHTVRDLSHLLHPALLDDLGLPAAIQWYLDGVGRRHGIAVELLKDRMDERMAPEIEAAAYRIVQEALTNVVKHAKATLAFVYIRRHVNSPTVTVTIEDNGVGFDPGKVRQGLGLIGIRERVAHLQGTVHLDSAPGKGTRLTVDLPARPRAAAPDVTDLESTDPAPVISPLEVIHE